MLKSALKSNRASRALFRAGRRMLSNPGIPPLARAAGKVACRSVKGYIFTAGTGRSGTTSLAHIFSKLKGCASFHEPAPIMNGEPSFLHNKGDSGEMWKIFNSKKLPEIYVSAAFSRWYLESNHLFIQCFGEAAVEAFGDKLHVIHLIRNRHEVARSILARGYIPGTPKGNHWNLDYHAPRNIVNMADMLDNAAAYSHPYFRCLWYWYETQARVEEFKRKHPETPVHRIGTEDLNSIDRVHDLMCAIGIDVEKDSLAGIVGIRANKSSSVPAQPVGIDPEALAEFENLCSAFLSDRSCLE